MVGDLFRKVSGLHGQRKVLQLANDPARAFLWSLVQTRPLSSPEILVYDLGPRGTELKHVVSISSKALRSKFKALDRRTKGLVN